MSLGVWRDANRSESGAGRHRIGPGENSGRLGEALEAFKAAVEAGEMTGFKMAGLGRMAAGKRSVGTGSASRIENTDD